MSHHSTAGGESRRQPSGIHAPHQHHNHHHKHHRYRPQTEQKPALELQRYYKVGGVGVFETYRPSAFRPASSLVRSVSGSEGAGMPHMTPSTHMIGPIAQENYTTSESAAELSAKRRSRAGSGFPGGAGIEPSKYYQPSYSASSMAMAIGGYPYNGAMMANPYENAYPGMYSMPPQTYYPPNTMSGGGAYMPRGPYPQSPHYPGSDRMSPGGGRLASQTLQPGDYPPWLIPQQAEFPPIPATSPNYAHVALKTALIPFMTHPFETKTTRFQSSRSNTATHHTRSKSINTHTREEDLATLAIQVDDDEVTEPPRRPLSTAQRYHEYSKTHAEDREAAHLPPVQGYSPYVGPMPREEFRLAKSLGPDKVNPSDVRRRKTARMKEYADAVRSYHHSQLNPMIRYQ